jgi:hypothetical protein
MDAEKKVELIATRKNSREASDLIPAHRTGISLALTTQSNGRPQRKFALSF